MKWLVRSVIVLIVSLAMISILPTLAGRFLYPNLVLGMVLALVVTRHTASALLWAGLGGFILDLSLSGRGWYFVTFVLIAMVGTAALNRHGESTIFPQALFVTLSILIMLILEQWTSANWSALSTIGLLVLNGGLTAMLIVILERMSRRRGRVL